MNNINKIIVQGKDITVLKKNDGKTVSLTQLADSFNNGNGLIEKWLSNKNTIEYLGAWEMLENKDFNYPEFGVIRNEAGTNRFSLSVKRWIESTNAIGLEAQAGRYGGTYAHEDIALEFCTWLSPIFRLLVVKEFKRLKEEESQRLGSQWDFRRFVSKVNYKIQTDTIKEVLVPIKNLPKEQERFIYAEEADLIYIAMFGFTSKQWREKYPQQAAKGLNIRDVANSHQLIVLANLESANSLLINAGYYDAKERLIALRKQSILELKSLRASNELEHELVISPNSLQHPSNIKKTDEKKDLPNTNFDNMLKGLLKVPPPKKDK